MIDARSLAAGVMDVDLVGDTQAIAGNLRANAEVIVLPPPFAEGGIDTSDLLYHFAFHEQAEQDKPACV